MVFGVHSVGFAWGMIFRFDRNGAFFSSEMIFWERNACKTGFYLAIYLFVVERVFIGKRGLSFVVLANAGMTGLFRASCCSGIKLYSAFYLAESVFSCSLRYCPGVMPSISRKAS